jgi:hypothetical protein
MREYDIVSEPTGHSYRLLLEHALKICSRAQLILQPGIKASENAAQLVAELESLGCQRAETQEWPGTELHGHSATALRFPYGEESVSLLLAYSRGLFDWRLPELPEDLALFRADGSVFLGTVAHERDAFLCVRDVELTEFERQAFGFLRPAE